MPLISESAHVLLRGGVSVPCEALQLLLDLERRGLEVSTEPDGLKVRPRERLTAEQVEAIRRHRDALIALVSYCNPPAR